MRQRHRSVRDVFRRTFEGEPAAIVRAPGRVNLIGEHTDYNDGLVLPVAIDRELLIAARRRVDSEIIAYSANFDQRKQISLTRQADSGGDWGNYVRGVLTLMAERGLPMTGMDLAIWSDIPVGAGLSSSAALELAVAEVAMVTGDFRLDRTELALLCQQAERRFAGVACGVMDQFVVALGRADHALFLDCRDLSFRHVPLSPNLRIVITDSRTRRQLAGSEYNRRRAECAEALTLLRTGMPNIVALRDLTWAALDASREVLPEELFRRCRHVVSENERVREAVAALDHGDLAKMGKIMNEGHDSLRADYRVSLPELDQLAEAARQAGAIGARLTGAGFGGCVVSVVPEERVVGFAERVREGYRRATGRQARSYVCSTADGTGVVG